MYKCPYLPIAIRVHPRTMCLIETIDDSVTLEGNEENFFMIYCANSDHEEYGIITPETYGFTYEKMPDHVLAMFVDTIH